MIIRSSYGWHPPTTHKKSTEEKHYDSGLISFQDIIIFACLKISG
jgi:hypothetical protein